jgi:hypothetical protein
MLLATPQFILPQAEQVVPEVVAAVMDQEDNLDFQEDRAVQEHRVLLEHKYNRVLQELRLNLV